MFEARGISVSLSGRPVLHDVSLALKPGELVVVVGPNGAGKSTVMKAMTGLLRPTRGDVLLDSVSLATIPRRMLARRRAVLAQNHSIAFPFTVFEVVALGLSAVGGPAPEEQRAIVRRSIAAVDLAGYEGRFFQQLSGGEQQRVQMARILCQLQGSARNGGDPAWLFLDEPTASLDIGHQLLVLDLAREHARNGGGAWAILHDLNLASLYADRLVVLSDGRAVADGAPKSVLTEGLIRSVFSDRVEVVADRRNYVLPVGLRENAAQDQAISRPRFPEASKSARSGW